MTEKTLIIVEVSGGCVIDVYAPNAEFIVLDWDNVKAGDALPTRDNTEEASSHLALEEDAFTAIFPDVA